jgi:hypothetical protein
MYVPVATVEGQLLIAYAFSVKQLLLSPGMIMMIIATTRMHRALIDYASGSPDVYDALNFFSFLSCSARAMSF